MSQHLLVILLVLSISMLCLGRPQGSSSSSGNEDVEFIQPEPTEKAPTEPTEKAPTELFFGTLGTFVGEVQVSTSSLTVLKKPKRKPRPSQNDIDGPRASALISDDSFSSFHSQAPATDVAVGVGSGLSLSSVGSVGAVLSFNKPAEVVPA